MIPRISKLTILDNYTLYVEFDDGYKVVYDVMDDIKTIPSYRAEMEEAITTPLYQIELETGIAISPIVMTKSQWDNRPIKTPFYFNVMREGILL